MNFFWGAEVLDTTASVDCHQTDWCCEKYYYSISLRAIENGLLNHKEENQHVNYIHFLQQQTDI